MSPDVSSTTRRRQAADARNHGTLPSPAKQIARDNHRKRARRDESESPPMKLHRRNEEVPSSPEATSDLCYEPELGFDGLIEELTPQSTGHVDGVAKRDGGALPSISSQVLNALANPSGPPVENGASGTDDDEEHGRRFLHEQWLKTRTAADHAGDGNERDKPVCRYALPTYLMYDARGLQLFDAITRLPDDIYYLTGAEAAILRDRADVLARHMLESMDLGEAEPAQPRKLLVLELGCGSMRKTKLILDALERAARIHSAEHPRQPVTVQFYALDLDRGELQRSIDMLQTAGPDLRMHPSDRPATPAAWERVRFRGLCGTYDQGLAWLHVAQDALNVSRRAVMWLGSSIGNFSRVESEKFLTKVRECVQGQDMLVLGVDGCTDRARIERAYNDELGVTRSFALNMLSHISRHVTTVDGSAFPEDAFEYAAVYNTEMRRHEAYLRAERDVRLNLRGIDDDEATDVDVQLRAGELVHIEYSVKYAPQDMRRLLRNSGWGVHANLANGSYGLYLLTPAPFRFPDKVHFPTSSMLLAVMKPDARRHSDTPTVEDWQQMWAAWDMVMHMLVKPEALHASHLRAIDVRLPLIFYLGHSPCFADRLVVRSVGVPLTEPLEFEAIFTRGVDPDLSDTTKCHKHSNIPDEWPAVEEVMKYQDAVRERILKLTRDSAKASGAKLAALNDGLSMAYEHDAMHLETLLYMVSQLPPEFINHDVLGPYDCEMERIAEPLAPASLIDMPSCAFTMGVPKDVAEYVWDNEMPEMDVQVSSFRVQSRPVSVHEYFKFLRDTMSAEELSALRGLDANSRLHCTERARQRRCEFSMVPSNWRLVGKGRDIDDWCIQDLRGQHPLSSRTRHPVQVSRGMVVRYIDWINSNAPEGQKWRLPKEAELHAMYDRHASAGGNIGFAGQYWSTCAMEDQTMMPGNTWEWTDTLFAPFPGFEAHSAYPEYSADFFDEHNPGTADHNVHYTVLGASWATHPRMALRRTFRNWYQSGYPFAFIGFRMVCGN